MNAIHDPENVLFRNRYTFNQAELIPRPVLVTDVALVNTRIDGMQATGDALLAALGNIQFQQTAMLNAINGARADMNRDFTALRGQVASLDGRVVALDGRVVALDGRVVALDGRVVALDGRVVALDGRVAALDGRVASLDGRVASLDGRMASVDKRMLGLGVELATVSNQVTLMSDDLAHVKNDSGTASRILLIFFGGLQIFFGWENKDPQELARMFGNALTRAFGWFPRRL